MPVSIYWRLSRYLTAAAAVLMFAPLSVHATPMCDPFQALADKARQEGNAGHPDVTEKIARSILILHSTDYHATYLLGWALVTQSKTDPSKFAPGMKQLLHAADLLKKQDTACAKARDWYALYPTIGYYFYLHGDLSDADQWFTLTKANLDKMSPASQQWALQNLSVFYFRKGDLKQTATFSAKANVSKIRHLNAAVQTIQGGTQ